MEDGPPGFPRGFTCPAVLRYLSGSAFRFGYEAVTRSGRTFQSFSPAKNTSSQKALQPRTVLTVRFGLIPFRSPLLWESRLISSPVGTEMFHFPTFASRGLWIQPPDDRTLLRPGFPIQTPGVQRILGSSPRLFAALRVFLRLSAPRHPPVALLNLFFSSFQLPYSIVK